MPSFAHILNPVTESESKNLFVAQVATFNSCIKAKQYYHDPGNISLYTVNERSHNDFIPSDFIQLPPLTRNISTVLTSEKLRLPFLNDILNSLYNNSDAEYFVYTNLDIALMPYFFTTVEQYIAQGHDAIIINRRRISNRFIGEPNLELMYAEAGKSHTGYDCFVFRRSLMEKFILKDICIGAPPAGNDLFHNFFTFAEKPVLLFDKHLTFHIGYELDNKWANMNIINHNHAVHFSMIKELYPYMDASRFPWSDKPFFLRQIIWLMNPTFHYPTMLRLDAKRKFKKTHKEKDTSYKPNAWNRWLEFLARYFYIE